MVIYWKRGIRESEVERMTPGLLASTEAERWYLSVRGGTLKEE